MRWTPGRRSKNLEDRRFDTGGGGFGRRGGMQLGCGGILLVAVLSIVFRQDFFSLLDTGSVAIDPGGPSLPSAPTGASDPKEEQQVDFVSFVLDDVQTTWTQIFPRLGGQYQDARLVVFRDAIESTCGFAESATGPFYCPGDQKVYLDLGFFDELRSRFGAPGDFAQAYVIAHEIGHHVQNLLGIEQEVRRAQRQRPGSANELSVRMELQADCLAGVWAHSTTRREILEEGDVEEGLGAAAAVGDDRIQKRSTGYVNPDAFTHGTAAQRVEWFRRGLETGDTNVCDTFGR